MTFVHPSDPRWRCVLASSPHDIYATPEYVLADAAIIGGEPAGFLAVEDDRLFLAPLIIREIDGSEGGRTFDATSPYGYPGIVMNDAGRTAPGFARRCFTHLLEKANARDIESIFLRLHPWINADLPALTEAFELTSTGSTVSIDLSGTEAALWSGMRKGHTNAINKATRVGFEVEITDVADSLDDLELVWRETLERLGKLPCDDRGVDRLKSAASLDEAHIAVARLHGEIAGAYLFFECQGIVQMHLGGTRTRFMRPSPSHLLIHSVARWAQRRGNTIVHLGGGVGGATSDSLFTFKAGFSRVRHPFRTVRLVVDSVVYDRLVDARAEALGVPRDAVAKSEHFPTYRVTRHQLAPIDDALDGRSDEGCQGDQAHG